MMEFSAESRTNIDSFAHFMRKAASTCMKANCFGAEGKSATPSGFPPSKKLLVW
jgi:hypothetical protein